MKLFLILAGLSLAVAGFWSVKFASLSYRVWAAERGVALPDRYVDVPSSFEVLS